MNERKDQTDVAIAAGDFAAALGRAFRAACREPDVITITEADFAAEAALQAAQAADEADAAAWREDHTSAAVDAWRKATGEARTAAWRAALAADAAKHAGDRVADEKR